MTKKLIEILEYATEMVQFYKDFHGLSFKELPLITKEVVLENLDKFQSDEYKS